MKNLLNFKNLKWLASIIGFIGAMTIALNTPYSKYAFMMFIISSTIWIIAGYKVRDWALVFLNIGFFIVDIIGLWRWF